MEGELLKRNKHIGWSRRYFVISKGVNSLFIYKDARKSEVWSDSLCQLAAVRDVAMANKTLNLQQRTLTSEP